MNIRKNGFVLLASFLAIVLVLSELGARYIERTRIVVNEARNAYIAALMQTRAQLSSHLHDLVRDPVLLSNFNSQLSYSMSRSLEGEIHPGTFDFYVLFDSECKPLVKTLSTPVPPGLCQKTKMGKWQWISVNGRPLLFLLKSRSDVDKPFSLGAGRFINEYWAASFPSLLSKLEAASLKLGRDPEQRLCKGFRLCSEFHTSAWSDGFDENKDALASLVSQNRIFPLLRPWLLSYEPVDNTPGLPLALLIIFFLAMHSLRARFAQTKTEEEKQRFLRWCQSPLSGHFRTPEMRWLEKAQESLIAVVTQCAHRNSELTKASEHYEKNIASLKAALQESERKLGEHIPHEVLSSHIAHSSQSVRDILSIFLEETGDLASILEKGLLPHSRKMMDVIKLWQNGINVRGERNFMRSLYEQPGKEEGETLLRSEMNKLFAMAETIHSTSLHSLNLVKQVQDKEGNAVKVLELWSMLAGKVNDPTLKLNRIGETSAALLQVSSLNRVSFLSNLPAEFTLKLPVPTLLGTFLMLFTSMKDGLRDAKDESLVFQIHKRQKQEEFILALSVTNERGKVLLCVPQEDLLKRAMDLLKPWGIQCQDIHRPEGGSYIVVRGSYSLTGTLQVAEGTVRPHTSPSLALS